MKTIGLLGLLFGLATAQAEELENNKVLGLIEVVKERTQVQYIESPTRILGEYQRNLEEDNPITLFQLRYQGVNQPETVSIVNTERPNTESKLTRTCEEKFTDDNLSGIFGDSEYDSFHVTKGCTGLYDTSLVDKTKLKIESIYSSDLTSEEIRIINERYQYLLDREIQAYKPVSK